MISIWEQWSQVHEPLENRTFLGKLFFNFLGVNILAPKSSHLREKQPVLGPVWSGKQTYFHWHKTPSFGYWIILINYDIIWKWRHTSTSLLNYMPYVPSCLRALRDFAAYLPWLFCALRALFAIYAHYVRIYEKTETTWDKYRLQSYICTWTLNKY